MTQNPAPTLALSPTIRRDFAVVIPAYNEQPWLERTLLK